MPKSYSLEAQSNRGVQGVKTDQSEDDWIDLQPRKVSYGESSEIC